MEEHKWLAHDMKWYVEHIMEHIKRGYDVDVSGLVAEEVIDLLYEDVRCALDDRDYRERCAAREEED